MEKSGGTRGIQAQVAPGLEVAFQIKFSPDAKIDYSYDLQIVTERERFIVPIVGTGRKALLSFPDVIDFGEECPVKFVTEKPGRLFVCRLLNNEEK